MLRRDDQIGCPIFTLIDELEARRSCQGRRPRRAHAGKPNLTGLTSHSHGGIPHGHQPPPGTRPRPAMDTKASSGATPFCTSAPAGDPRPRDPREPRQPLDDVNNSSSLGAHHASPRSEPRTSQAAVAPISVAAVPAARAEAVGSRRTAVPPSRDGPDSFMSPSAAPARRSWPEKLRAARARQATARPTPARSSSAACSPRPSSTRKAGPFRDPPSSSYLATFEPAERFRQLLQAGACRGQPLPRQRAPSPATCATGYTACSAPGLRMPALRSCCAWPACW